jgi:hypothetical protein
MTFKLLVIYQIIGHANTYIVYVLGERNLIFRFTDPPTQFFPFWKKKNSNISKFQQFHVQPKQVLNFPFTVESAKHQ